MSYSLIKLPESKYLLTYRLLQWSNLRSSIHTIYGNSLDDLYLTIKIWNKGNDHAKFVILETKKL